MMLAQRSEILWSLFDGGHALPTSRSPASLTDVIS
jgi:hypothetical protein